MDCLTVSVGQRSGMGAGVSAQAPTRLKSGVGRCVFCWSSGSSCEDALVTGIMQLLVVLGLRSVISCWQPAGASLSSLKPPASLGSRTFHPQSGNSTLNLSVSASWRKPALRARIVGSGAPGWLR